MKSRIEFQQEIYNWLANSFENLDLSGVEAYYFSLYEMKHGFAIDLIGAPKYMKDDSDWPCEEVVVSSPRRISIPEELHNGNWETCQNNIFKFLIQYLHSNDKNTRILKSVDAVVVGFVDGDILTLFSRVD